MSLPDRLRIQLSAGIHAALAAFGHHMALLTRALPQSAADELLSRPDASGHLRSGLSSAQQLASALVRQAWDRTSGGA